MSAESKAVMSNPTRRDARWGRPPTRPLRLLGALGAAVALASAFGVAGTAAAQARLTSVSTVSEGRAVTIVIEASEPAPYVVAHPDPLTVVVDLRNVTVAGVSPVGARRAGPIADVAVEDARADDGVAVARIRVSLAAPVKPAVRSRRGSILIEFGTSGTAASAASPASAAGSQAPPAAAQSAPAQPKPVVAKPAQAGKGEPLSLKHIDVTQAPFGTRVTVAGTGPLPGEPQASVSLVDATPNDPPRLVLDLPGVTAQAQTVPGPADSPVVRVRVAQNSRQPLIARVVIDLKRPTPYRIDHVGGQLTVILEPAAAAPPETPPAAPAVTAPVTPPATQPAPVKELPQATPAAAAAAVPPEAPPVAPAAAPKPAEPGPTPVVVKPAARASAPAPAPEVQKQPARATEVPAAAQKPAVEPAKPAPPPPAAPPAPVTPREAEPSAPPTAAPVAQPDTTKAPPVAQAAEPPAGQRTYTGTPVTFDFVGADLRAVLRAFSDKDISGLNVVIDPSIQGTVDVSLREVPWDQALEVILRAHKLGYVIENNVVRIASLKALAEEEQERQKLAETQAKGGQLKVLTRALSYAKAADLAKLLKDARVITERGTAFVDERSNTLIINDLPAAIAECESLIAVLDQPEPQVEIEARIVQTTRENARALGVQWGMSGRAVSELGNTTPLRFPAQGSVSGRTGGVQGNPIGPVRSETPTGVNLPVTGATSAVGLAMGTLNGSFNLDVALSALEKKGHGRILSTPRVVMQNNVEAEMYQGIQIPIQTVSNNTVTVTFKDAALSLKVRPQITASGTVIMNINLENASPDYSRQVNGIPPIDTQRAVTEVLVNDGETTVIGGIQVQRETNANDRVPGLARIPLLGWLFRRSDVSDDSRELLIFITPKIRR